MRALQQLIRTSIWVMTLDGQPFLVRALQPENGHYVGTLSRPLRITTDGKSISGTGEADREALRRPLGVPTLAEQQAQIEELLAK